VSAFEPGLRRTPTASLDVGSEPELVARIRTEIESTGPITFARFMERALYEPDLGYYRRDRPGAGRSGDFLTAPEMHPIFGRAVARELDELWHILGAPQRFVVREYGAGGGALAKAVLNGLRSDGSDLADVVRYQAVEVDRRRVDAIGDELRAADFGERLEDATSEPIVGCVLANEVLDALPVHRVVLRHGVLRELCVDFEGDRFIEVEASPTTPEIGERLASEEITLEEGQVAEICLELDAWVADAAAGLERGLLLLVDYGHEAAELYGPRRRAGTLMAYTNHQAHDDPFINVGRQDLTAHVDVTALERAAARAGLDRVGVTTQAEFLVGLGIGDILSAAQSDPSTTIESYLELRSSVGHLLDPAATGGFKVMAFGRGLPSAGLRGFAFILSR
jgi:SAM-dependent MidA family methyltransferase